MQGGPMHLRRKREVHAGRRTTRSRLPLFGGGMVLILGVACLAPLAPTALAPATLSATAAMVAPTPELGGVTRPAAVAPAPVSAAPQIGVPAIAIPPLPVPAAPSPTPATVTSPI